MKTSIKKLAVILFIFSLVSTSIFASQVIADLNVGYTFNYYLMSTDKIQDTPLKDEMFAHGIDFSLNIMGATHFIGGYINVATTFITDERITFGNQTEIVSIPDYKNASIFNLLVGPVFKVKLGEDFEFMPAVGFHMVRTIFKTMTLENQNDTTFGIGTDLNFKYHPCDEIYITAGSHLDLDFGGIVEYKRYKFTGQATVFSARPYIGLGIRFGDWRDD